MPLFSGRKKQEAPKLPEDLQQALEAIGEQAISDLQAFSIQQHEELRRKLEERIAAISDPMVRDFAEKFTTDTLTQNEKFLDEVNQTVAKRIRRTVKE